MGRVTLCTKCSALPFNEDDPPLSEEGTPWKLGLLSDLRNKPTCSLCRLARFAIETERWPYALTDLVTLQWFDFRKSFSVNASRHGSLCFVRGSNEPQSQYKIALQVTRPTLDLARAKGWLDFCVRKHPNCNKLSAESLSFSAAGHLRLINVITKCIVEVNLPRRYRYIALSYVWGGANNFRLTSHNILELSRPGSLLKNWSRIPRTIRDAVNVVQELGEQYLWVDSLCLVQNDSADMRNNIEVMDLIYESAVLTIIAASGSHADAGLPGAGSTSRMITQRVAHVKPGLKLACHLDLDHLLNESAYNQRGWTFQEMILSRKALIFVDNQLYFRCRDSCYSEDIIDPTGEYIPVHSIANNSSMLPKAALMEYPEFDWDTILMYYSERTFSNQSDAQLAMAGIARRASQRMRCSFFEGIPTAAFDVYVIFHKTSSILRRRRGFPSYTWAGWIGRIHGDTNHDTYTNAWLLDHTWIIWHKRSPRGIVNPIWDIMANENFPVHDRDVLGYRKRSPFGARHSVRSTRTTPTENFRFSRDPPGYPMLQFWTLVLSFTISNFDVFKGTASILDRRGVKCGAIDMDGFEDDEFFQRGSQYDFILLSDILSEGKDILSEGKHILSEGKHVCAYSDAHPSDWEAYNVLVLEWSGDVAERRGIGSLCRFAIERSLLPGPYWKEILLA